MRCELNRVTVARVVFVNAFFNLSLSWSEANPLSLETPHHASGPTAFITVTPPGNIWRVYPYIGLGCDQGLGLYSFLSINYNGLERLEVIKISGARDAPIHWLVERPRAPHRLAQRA
jgi:hypothetical protein